MTPWALFLEEQVMANLLQNVPFNVKLGGKAMVFHCQETKFGIHGKQIKTVNTMSDQIKQWLMAGGLEVTDEEATGEVAGVAAAPKTTPKKPAAGTPKPKGKNGAKPKSTPEGDGKETSEGEDGEGAGGEGGEPSVDDILNENK